MTYKIKSPIADGKRRCTKCNDVKPLEEFYLRVLQCANPRRGSVASLYYSECKDCFRERERQIRERARQMRKHAVAK